MAIFHYINIIHHHFFSFKFLSSFIITTSHKSMNIPNPAAAIIPAALYFLAGLFFFTTAAAQNESAVPVNVGVVLDMESWIGKMGLSCIDMSLSEFYSLNPHYHTRIVLHPKDSGRDVVGAAAAGSPFFLSFSLYFYFPFCCYQLPFLSYENYLHR